MSGAPIESDDPAVLRAEIRRLHELIGQDERSYVELKSDLLAARDVAIGARAAEGVQRGQVAQLEVHVARARRVINLVNRGFAPAQRIVQRAASLARRIAN